VLAVDVAIFQDVCRRMQEQAAIREITNAQQIQGGESPSNWPTAIIRESVKDFSESVAAAVTAAACQQIRQPSALR
jgi:hypothetical protein